MDAIKPHDFTKRFQIDPVTVYDLIKNGSLHAVDIAVNRGGRPSWRIPQACIDDFVEQRSSSITRPIIEV